MGFCPNAGRLCPLAMNMADLCNGTLGEDSISPATLLALDEYTLSRVTETLARLIDGGTCDGPTKGEDCQGPEEDPWFLDSSFCGLTTFDDILEAIDVRYGFNLLSRSPDS